MASTVTPAITTMTSATTTLMSFSSSTTTPSSIDDFNNYFNNVVNSNDMNSDNADFIYNNSIVDDVTAANTINSPVSAVAAATSRIFFDGANVGEIIHNNGTDELDMTNNQIIQITFCVLYTIIFVVGVFGNALVCYVVIRNRAMQTVTNLFITNLALSDILLCILAVPFTPLYTFLRRWVFGSVLCHLVAYAQGCSVYISTLTLTSIAVDRFFVIIYPFHPRMKLSTCILIIISIWSFALLVTLPYGLYVQVAHLNYTGQFNHYCEEDWPSEHYRKVFGSFTSMLQFALPFLIISFCYICVSMRLNDRAKAKPGTKSTRKEEVERIRKKRTNRMLIAMVTIFGISWLPINVVNVINDFYANTGAWTFYNFLFLITHTIAMSSTCYNPFLYAWLNDNFRKEFKQVLPCFTKSMIKRKSQKSDSQYGIGWQPEPTYNGNNETIQESLVTSSFVRNSLPSYGGGGGGGGGSCGGRDSFHGRKNSTDHSILLSDITNSTDVQGTSVIISTSHRNRNSSSPETIQLPSGVLETNFEEINNKISFADDVADDSSSGEIGNDGFISGGGSRIRFENHKENKTNDKLNGRQT